MLNKNIGVLVPPANTTVEPELWKLVPEGFTVLTNRLPGRVSENTSIGLRERFLGYNETLAESADSYGGLPLGALCFACTGSSYLIGAANEDVLLNRMRSGGTSVVNTAAQCVSALLKTLGAHRIGIISPYPKWVTELAVVYWTECGFVATGYQHVADVVSIYAINTDSVIEAARQVLESKPDVLLLSGTGMMSLDAIAQLSERVDVPAISSNLAMSWWATNTIEPGSWARSPSAAMKSLLKRLPVGAVDPTQSGPA